MGGNEFPGGVLLDLYDLQVTGDESPQAGAATEVTVFFRVAEPFHATFLVGTGWPYEVKVYAEGYGDFPGEYRSFANGTCNATGPDYQVKVPVTLPDEGVYKVTAIVELSNNAGWVMGFSDQEVQITVWTAG